MDINIGIPEKSRKEISKGLSRVLADSYTLYLKTHNYHWNVTGPMFQTLHTMFEEHYTELATAVDDIAERIRALGEFAPGSYTQFKELSVYGIDNYTTEYWFIEEDDSVKITTTTEEGKAAHTPSAEANFLQEMVDNNSNIRWIK